MLAKLITGLIGLIVFFDLNPPAAFCQQPTAPGVRSMDGDQTSGRRVYARRVLRPNRVSGVAVVNYFGAGLGLGYDRIVSRDFHIGFSGVYTQARLQGPTGFDNAREFLDGNMLRLSATPRYFIWRNLYAGAGLNLSSISGEFGFLGSAIVDQRSAMDFSGTHLNADLLLGNEWRFGRIFLAVDWVGLSFFQASSIQASETSDLAELSRFLTGDNPAIRIEKEIEAQVSFTYLTARIGISF